MQAGRDVAENVLLLVRWFALELRLNISACHDSGLSQQAISRGYLRQATESRSPRSASSKQAIRSRFERAAVCFELNAPTVIRPAA